jgi:hypothetical protein
MLKSAQPLHTRPELPVVTDSSFKYGHSPSRALSQPMVVECRYNGSQSQCYNTDKDHWFDMSIRDLTWATVATKLATLPPIFGGLICLSCPLVCVLLSTYYVWPTVSRKNTDMNYLLKFSSVGSEVVKESSSRSRVTWFKSQSRDLFFFIYLLHLLPTNFQTTI